MKYLFPIFFLICLWRCQISVAQTKHHTGKRNYPINAKRLSDAEKEILYGQKHYKRTKNISRGKAILPKPSFVQTKPIHDKAIIRNGKKLTGQILSTQGFRICIYNGIQREKALQIKQQIASSNHLVRSYLVYKRPNYKVNIGDYIHKKAAQQDLKRWIVDYPTAFIIPDIVIYKNIAVHTTHRKQYKRRTSK